ncbi:MAG: CBS domain-containing protein [Bryobacteraceae bacterium]
MNPNPVTVPVTETFAGAFAIMAAQRQPALPVVDEAGVYKGMFDFEDVWELLLPKAAVLGLESLTNLAFLNNASEKLREKLEEAGPRPIRHFLDAKVQPVHPDTPVKEVILQFHRYNTSIPVVERGVGRLAGLISPWDLLDGLR